VEAKDDDIHVEDVEIDYSLVAILLVGTLAAVFEEELDKTVHRLKYFSGKGIVGGNSFFVGDAVSSFNIRCKFFELDC
jgi:hypothetical protein